MVPLAAGQEIFVETVPAVVREQLGTSDVASQILAYPAEEAGTEQVAERIQSEVDAVHAMTVDKFRNEIEASVSMFNAIIIGVALISLVVGGLSVINTMAMSVQERTREIGIKRAIGGSRGRVIRELVGEAALIGLVGGLIGLGLGAAVVALANEAGRASATVLFDLTVGTSLFALGFSTVLGMAAGLIPAWNAARLDPVQALRHE
jgi:putative ABC transport system permease protein